MRLRRFGFLIERSDSRLPTPYSRPCGHVIGTLVWAAILFALATLIALLRDCG